MERCPICRGRIEPNALCSRCGADLKLPLLTATQAQAFTLQAVRCLAEGDFSAAEQQLRSALRLQNNPLTRTLLGFVCDHQFGGQEQEESGGEGGVRSLVS